MDRSQTRNVLTVLDPATETRAERAEIVLSLVALAAFLAAFSIRYDALQHLYRDDGWVTGGWLVNYSGGFIRRGLAGQAALLAHNYWGANQIALVLAAKFAAVVALSTSMLILAARKRIGAVELILFLAPWAVMADLMYAEGTGRKELLLYAAFAAFTVIPRRWAWWFLPLALPVLTLIHEGLFFFLQFFWLLIAARSPSSRTELRAFGVGYALAFAALLASFIFEGDQRQVDVICTGLTSTGIAPSLCDGGITSLAGFQFHIYTGYFWIFAPPALLTVAPLAIYARGVLDPAVTRRLAAGTLIALIPTVPVYYLAADWGRWIHATALLFFLTLLTLKSRRTTLAALPKAAVAAILIAAPVYLFTWHLSNTIWDTDIVPLASAFRYYARSLLGF